VQARFAGRGVTAYQHVGQSPGASPKPGTSLDGD